LSGPSLGPGTRHLRTYLDFEKSVADVEGKIEELAAISEASGSEAWPWAPSFRGLKVKAEKQLADIYSKLDPWQKTQVARHRGSAALPAIMSRRW
jgi:acetyl-CoA carboxylase carboxyl transferase subunit alpha